jgi:hypothetical protein
MAHISQRPLTQAEKDDGPAFDALLYAARLLGALCYDATPHIVVR